MKNKQELLPINTILHTKDGRKIGNAIITHVGDYEYKVITDYGNKSYIEHADIHDIFYVGFIDCTVENDGMSYEEMQAYVSEDHKHRVIYT